jgi:hypothetical protein
MTTDVDIEHALSSALVPAGHVRKPKKKPNFYLDVVVRSGLDVSIAEAITGGEIERTMDGASTLSLTLFDPHRALLRNPDLSRAIDMAFGGYWWRLVKVAKSGDNLTLTFEDRDVAYLRAHNTARKANRNTITRAQFVQAMVREVGHRDPKRSRNRPAAQKRITFVCPELKRVQPIDHGKRTKAPSKRTKKHRAATKQAGLNPKARLTVKGARATREQRRNGERVLDIADDLRAGPKATKALMEAVIVESQIRNLSFGDRDSIGILQVRVSLHGRAIAASIERSVHAFLTRGFTGKGGAIKLAHDNPSWSAARIAQAVQGSQPAVYGQYAGEAERWVHAYGGASGNDSGGTAKRDTPRGKKKYEFRRGEPGKREDSWTAIQRLAEEVAWHAFMDRGRLYYVSDDYLIRQKARFIVDEADDGVLEINFDIDSGKVSSDVSVIARAALFQVPVGCVVGVEDCGIANGRYVVTTVHQGIFDNACEITLRAPTPKLAEPEAEDKEAVKRGAQADVRGARGTGGSSLRNRIVAVAKASAASYRRNPNAWHYLAGGQWNVDDPTRPPRSRGMRSDCSQWVIAVYKKAGAPAPGPSFNSGYTGTMAVKGHFVPTSQAKPGDIILYGSPPYHHVELYVGPGQTTIGHGSTPVDEGRIGMMSNPHCWRYNFLD